MSRCHVYFHDKSNPETELASQTLGFLRPTDEILVETSIDMQDLSSQDSSVPHPAWSNSPLLFKSIRKPRSLRIIATWPNPSVDLGRNEKLVHLVRHGQGYHNLWAEESGDACDCEMPNEPPRCPYLRLDTLDAELTEKGKLQAENIREIVTNEDRGLPFPKLVVVSPMRRALQTATLAFHGVGESLNCPPFLAREEIREHLGVHWCDKRLPRSALREQFPHIDFEGVQAEVDEHFDERVRETRASMADRSFQFLTWLNERPERSIAVVCHSGILSIMLRSVIECEAEEIANHFQTGELRTLVLRFEESASDLR